MVYPENSRLASYMDETLFQKKKINKKQAKVGLSDGEMAQWLRAVAMLSEDLGLTPSTHMAAHNLLQFQGIRYPLFWSP